MKKEYIQPEMEMRQLLFNEGIGNSSDSGDNFGDTSEWGDDF